MAIHIERTIKINAPPERVWAVMTDVERWPEWTESMRSVRRLEAGDFGLGSTARVEAKGAPASVFTVTEFTPGWSFTWDTQTRGIRARASHVIDADGDRSNVTLGVTMSGLAATLFFPLLAFVARRNVRMEAKGLKRRAEDSQRITSE